LQQNQLTLAEDFPILEYEVEKARKLLKEIQDPQQKVGQDIKDAIQKGFKLYYHSEIVADDRICTEFANEIEKNLGIPIELAPMSKSEWFEKIKQGDFQIAYGRGVFNQDVNVIESLFRSGSDQNIGNYKNREIDKLLDEYNRANHPELRGRIRKEMATIIAEEVPFTFLYRIPKRAAFRNDVLGRVNIHPFYFFSFIDGWYMKP
jgi:ABC-type oligopeptide transport system substrate-binding subunit